MLSIEKQPDPKCAFADPKCACPKCERRTILSTYSCAMPLRDVDTECPRFGVAPILAETQCRFSVSVFCNLLYQYIEQHFYIELNRTFFNHRDQHEGQLISDVCSCGIVWHSLPRTHVACNGPINRN